MRSVWVAICFFCSSSYLLIHTSLVSFSAAICSFCWVILSVSCFLWISNCFSRDFFWILNSSQCYSEIFNLRYSSSYLRLKVCMSLSVSTKLVFNVLYCFCSSSNVSSVAFLTLLATCRLSAIDLCSLVSFVFSRAADSYYTVREAWTFSNFSSLVLTSSISCLRRLIRVSRSRLISSTPMICRLYSCASFCKASYFS